MLLIGDDNFGDFGSYSAPPTSQLRIRIHEAGEAIYLGLGRAYNFDGTPKPSGGYFFRLRRLSDDVIVHGPILVNGQTSNLEEYADAVAGPAPLNPGGYPTGADFTYQADEPGDYVLEFSSQIRYAGLWDVTVANGNTELGGRVYSLNWAFRVPAREPELPDCIWSAQMNARFYSYTTDGFVTEIEFAEAGFQPLSFNLAFNRTGPGQSGVLEMDRMSVAEINATGNSAEHLIFIDNPDPIIFPDGECGSVSVAGGLRCEGAGFCVPVAVTQAGQVELILDFNGNQQFDEATDRLLLYEFIEGEDLEHCIFWDGLLADGSTPPAGATVNILAEYTQGVQHWALFDGEKMNEGFCVSPVRPICGMEGTARLYYDDRNIPDDSGTAAPNDGRMGCDCATPDCRTWTNFDAGTNDCDDIDDEATSGYGDKNTLNTWWFASSQSESMLQVPLGLVTVDGPAAFCPGEEQVLSVSYFSPQPVSSVGWIGPNGFAAQGAQLLSVTVSDPGLYTVTITDDLGCSNTTTFLLEAVSCTAAAEIVSVTCLDNGTPSDDSDDLFAATLIVNGGPGNSWTATDGSLAANYGETVELGPFPITAGSVEIELRDDLFGCCGLVVPVQPPPTCSGLCAITQSLVENVSCNDAGTPTDPSDDTFTFEVTLDGLNLSGNWVSSEGTMGSYGVATMLGPFPISGGDLMLDITDAEAPDCGTTVQVMAPPPCSDLCLFEPAISGIVCDDNGTPRNPFDDVFFFTLDVASINATSVAYEIIDQTVGLYGISRDLGPYLIEDGILDLVIVDVDDEGCSQSISVTPPAPCSPECGLEIVAVTPICGDNGTPDDPTDDAFFYEITVNSFSDANTTWVANDGSTGDYGVPTRSVAYDPGGGDFFVTVTDATNPHCTDTVLVEIGTPEIDCPADLSEITDQGGRLSYFGARASNIRNYFGPDEDPSCWLEYDQLSPGQHFYDRFTIVSDALPGSGPEIYAFYLFSPVLDTSVVGAVFKIEDEEPLDCCDLVNEAPVGIWNGEALPPYVPDSLYNDTMVLRQQFSVQLLPGEVYSVVTTMNTPDTLRNYEWIIVAANGSTLETSSELVQSSTVGGTVLTYDLYLNQLGNVQNQSGPLAAMAGPTASGGCGATSFVFSDSLTSEACGDATLTRTYDLIFRDSLYANVCTQTFTFSRMSLGDPVMPAQNFQFTCTDTFPELENGNPHPDYTGRPAIMDLGQTIFLTEIPFEGLRATFTDRDSVGPGPGRIILRDWVISGECEAEDRRFTQMFKLEVEGMPELGCPLSTHFCPILEDDIMLFAVDTFACTATVDIPLPDLLNICDTLNWSIFTRVLQIDGVGGSPADTLVLFSASPNEDRIWNNAPPGDYFVEYTAISTEQDTIDLLCRIRVADAEQPTAVCGSHLSVAIAGNGGYRLLAQHLDQGSFDNCPDFTLEVRRLLRLDPADCGPLESIGWSAWAGFVDFNCCDVGDDSLFVQLRIIDAAGNVNFCQSQITLTDNILPACVNLPDTVVSCDELPNEFDPTDSLLLRQVFGFPEVIDNCVAFATELSPIVFGDICNPNRIIRRFRAEDQSGNVSASLFFQEVEIIPSSRYTLRFPRDTETDCETEVDTLGIIGGGCDDLEISISDLVLPSIAGECRRIARTFRVTDRCTWDGVSDFVTLSRDTDCDGGEGEYDLWLIREPDTTFLDQDGDPFNTLPPAGSTDCSPTNPSGYLELVNNTGRWAYTQIITVVDTEAPTITATYVDSLYTTGPDCTRELNLTARLADGCGLGPNDITFGVDLGNDGTIDTSFTLSDAEVSGFVPIFDFTYALPIGDHLVVVSASDACGNTGTAGFPVAVFDAYVPDLQCLDYQIFNLQDLGEPTDIDNDGELEFAAVYVDAAELGYCLTEDCSPGLNFTLNRPGTTPTLDQNGIYLDCGDRYQTALELYVWDNAFNPLSVQPDGSLGGPNWRRCELLVLVQDPNQACPDCPPAGSLTLGGFALGSALQYLPGVVVEVSETGLSTATNGNGRFTFVVAGGGAYTVRAHKNDDTRAGLSTLDVLLIQLHILQQRIITDPYERIAADVNADGTVDLIDLLQLQSVLIGTVDLFPENTSWRFVPATWDGTGNPPDGVHFGELTDCINDANLVGIKVGDLNGSITPPPASTLATVTPREATFGEIGLPIEDRSFGAGMTIEVAIPLPGAETHAAAQFSLGWSTDRLRYLGRDGEDFGPHEINDREASAGRLLVSSLATSLVKKQLLLRFEALDAGQLSDFLHLATDGPLRHEAYAREPGRIDRLRIDWLPATAGEVNPLVGLLVSDGRAFPNPTTDLSYLRVVVPRATTATLDILDPTGRVLRTESLALAAGRNQPELNLRSLRPGLYGYRLTAGGHQWSGLIVKH